MIKTNNIKKNIAFIEHRLLCPSSVSYNSLLPERLSLLGALISAGPILGHLLLSAILHLKVFGIYAWFND